MGGAVGVAGVNPATSRPGRPTAVGPFVAFAVVGALAAIGAVFEISYWIGVSAFSGVAVGIVLALIAFFTWGLLAPPNE